MIEKYDAVFSVKWNVENKNIHILSDIEKALCNYLIATVTFTHKIYLTWYN